MTDESQSGLRLTLDPGGLAAHERLVAYEMVNSLLLDTIELQRAFAMRPLEFQVFMVIAMATVQRFMRESQPEAAYVDATPLPTRLRGTISRRRIAETLDLPFETVRRTVARLLARGAVIESGRGLLSTGGGTLQRASEGGAVARMAQHSITIANRMLQTGAATLTPPGPSKRTAT